MIRKILHISDLHIRLYKRYQEYIEFIPKLEERISQLATQQSVIIFSGDLFHSKTELSPESITMAHRYIETLLKYNDVIVILGNHDANLANKSRLDALQPIVQLISNTTHQHSLLFYRDSGIYKYKNLTFYLCSVIDYELKAAAEIRMNSDIQNLILLYHGPTVSSQLQNQYQLTQARFSVADFNGYDMVIAGDIHKQQILQYYSKRKNMILPCVAYAGSLIQNNHGQEYNNHGVLVWDVQNRTCKFEQILNDYGYHTITVENNKVLTSINNLSKHPKIRIKYKNTDQTILTQLVSKLQKKYAIKQLIKIKINDQKSVIQSKQIKYNIQNIFQISYQQKMILQFLQFAKIQVTKQQLNEIFQLNRKYNQNIKLIKTQIATNQNWKLLKFEFENLFSFKGRNVIQFQTFNGLIGLSGQNKVGKTSIVQSVLFTLFDKTPRASSAINIINNKSTQFYAKLTFQINGIQYVIEKTGKITKYGLPVKIKFYTYNEDGSILDLSGKQRSQTNAIIQSYIGSFSDSIFTAFSIQGNSNGFLDLGQANRKQFLNRLLRLNIFDILYEQANQDARYYKTLISNEQSVQLYKSIQTIKQQIQKLQLIIDQNQKDRVYTAQLIQQQQFKLQELLNSKHTVQDDSILNLNYDSIVSLIQQKKLKINSLSCLIKKTNDAILQYNSKLKQLNIDKQKIDYKLICQKCEEFQQIKYQSIQIYNNLNNKNTQLQQQSKKIKLLEKLKYDVNCEYCMSNPLTLDAISSKNTKKQLDLEVKQLSKTLLEYSALMQEHEEYLKIKNTYEELVQYINKNTSQLNTEQSQLFKYESQQQKIKQQLKETIILKQKYNKYIDVIENNQKIQNNILEIKNSISSHTSIVNILQQQIFKYKSELQLLIYKKQEIINSIKSYELNSKKYFILEKYKSIINKQGLQYFITSKIISILQAQINEVLLLISNFIVKFQLDGKNIDLYIHYDDNGWEVQTCSGFQKFIISIAIRAALNEITNLPKPQFLVIDQGFGVLDSQNLNSMESIFNFLKSKYTFIIIISHIDIMKSMFQKFINVVNQNGESRIV